MMQDVKLWFDRNLKGDPIIWGIVIILSVIILSVISIVVVYSATGSLAFKYTGGNTEKYLIDHSIMVLAGLMVMWVAHKIPYRTFGLIGKFLLVISIPLLFFTYVFGSTVNEANRWLTIPVINKAFQPSDIAKLALIATLASLLARNQKNISDFRNAFLPMMVVIGLVCGLIGLANMSTAVLLLTTCLLLLLIGRVPVKYIMMVVLVGSLFLTSSILIGQRGSTFFSRIENFVSGDELPFQAEQSFIAISTGGITGKGPGKSEQRNTLPHPYSDFIYAIIIEEYGLVGGATVLFLYMALLFRGMRIVASSTKPFGGLLSAGLSFALVLQAMVNMAVAVGLGPITGLPLPLLSMGGTSLVFTGLSLGIILSVSRGDHQDMMENATEGNRIRKGFQTA